jgi:hypothetical protein
MRFRADGGRAKSAAVIGAAWLERLAALLGGALVRSRFAGFGRFLRSCARDCCATTTKSEAASST